METRMLQSGGTSGVKPLIVPDGNTKDDSILNISRSLDKENECCMTSYSAGRPIIQTHLPCQSDKLKITIANADRAACSSSCENLRVSGKEKDSIFIEANRLSKANSDNPVFGTQSTNCMPPIPPRDYLWHATSKTPKAIEIHPVLQDGEKLSNTHYWLLPGKQPQQIAKGIWCCETGDKKKKKGDENYMNLKEAEACEKSKKSAEQAKLQACMAPGSGKNKLHVKDTKIGRFLCDGRTGIDDDEPLLDAGCGDRDDAYDNATIEAMLDPDVKLDKVGHWPSPRAGDPRSEERCTSLGEAKDMIEVVHAAVEGVTLEESQAALSLLQWNADAAIKYLKVESLFRLALASRSRCKQVLQLNQWDLNKAASDLLDFSTPTI